MNAELGQDAGPRLAIVVPVYGHPGLVSEAICSAIEQIAPFAIEVVVVNDGCPNPETDAVVSTLRAAHPGRLTYIRKPNGGLSSARNAGIRHVLERLPSAEAIFMLDADNRLRPTAMARAMETLDAHPDAGWVYPSIDMFGIKARCDYGGPYSRLIHSQTNISEAGSLIRRTVFEAGVMFDESFWKGFEDWHFFLAAGDAGFRGVNLEGFGFLYRKRPESMLANSNRDVGALAAHVRAMHPEVNDPRVQMALEQSEAPRYAILEGGRLRLTTDPDLPGEEMSLEDYVRLYWRSRTSPMQHRVPPFLAVLAEGLGAALKAHGLLAWTFWRLEHAALTHNIGYLGHRTALRAGGVALTEGETGPPTRRENAVAWLVGPDALGRLLSAGEASPAEERPEAPEATGAMLRADLEMAPGPAAEDLGRALAALRGSRFRAAGSRRWTWRQPSIALRGREHTIARKSFAGQPTLPRVAGEGPEIGVLLPGSGMSGQNRLLAGFQARRAGGRLHLVVPAERTGPVDPALADTLILLCSEGIDGGAQTMLHYESARLPEPAEPGAVQAALGALFWLSELHNFGHRGAHLLMGPLRRFGVRTVLHLGAVGDGPPGVSDIQRAIAFEHAYDRIVAPDEDLARHLIARGVPAAKLEYSTATVEPEFAR